MSSPGPQARQPAPWGRRLWNWGLPLVLLVGAGLTCPDERQHQAALLDAIRSGHAVSGRFDPSERDQWPVDYRSYGLFSLTRLHDQLTAVGAFGRVVVVGRRGRTH